MSLPSFAQDLLRVRLPRRVAILYGLWLLVLKGASIPPPGLPPQLRAKWWYASARREPLWRSHGNDTMENKGNVSKCAKANSCGHGPGARWLFAKEKEKFVQRRACELAIVCSRLTAGSTPAPGSYIVRTVAFGVEGGVYPTTRLAPSVKSKMMVCKRSSQNPCLNNIVENKKKKMDTSLNKELTWFWKLGYDFY